MVHQILALVVEVCGISTIMRMNANRHLRSKKLPFMYGLASESSSGEGGSYVLYTLPEGEIVDYPVSNLLDVCRRQKHPEANSSPYFSWEHYSYPP